MLGGKTGVPYSCRETGPLEEGCKNPLLWKNGNTWLLLHVFATALKKKQHVLLRRSGIQPITGPMLVILSRRQSCQGKTTFKTPVVKQNKVSWVAGDPFGLVGFGWSLWMDAVARTLCGTTWREYRICTMVRAQRYKMCFRCLPPQDAQDLSIKAVWCGKGRSF